MVANVRTMASHEDVLIVWSLLVAVKKSGSLVQLVEGEKGVINLDKVEDGMVSAVTSLKQSFATAVVTRLNPSEWYLGVPKVLMTLSMCCCTSY